MSNIINKLQQYPDLIKFCEKIMSYNAILEDETARNTFLVYLISADVLVDEHACANTIEVASFILDHLNLFVLDDDVKKNVKKHLEESIKIARRDKKKFVVDSVFQKMMK